MKSLVRSAETLCTTVAVVALFAMMVMTFLDVIMRSAADSPLGAAPELTRVLMAVVVFSVLPVVSARGKHISVDLLDHFIPAGLLRCGDVLVDISCGVMLLWPASRCIALAQRARDYGDVTEFLGIPTFYIAWFITVSVFATAAVLILRGIATVFFPMFTTNQK